MKPLHLFAPLRKQPGFPKTAAKMTVGDIRYDLILPAKMSDLLLLHFIRSGGAYRQADRYSDSAGFEQIHAQPTLLDDLYPDAPAYAVAFNGAEDVVDDDDLVGFVAVRLAVGPLGARQLYNRSVSRKSIDPTLAEYIGRRSAYFSHCGGFELLRVRYYVDAADRYQVMLDMEADEPPSLVLRERSTGKTRFRDMR